MKDRTLDHAMLMAASMKALREVEMEDARRFRAMRDRCQEPAAREFLQRHIVTLVSTARKWNRQMLIAQRDIRLALYRRQFCRSFTPAEPPRGLAALRHDGRIAE